MKFHFALYPIFNPNESNRIYLENNFSCRNDVNDLLKNPKFTFLIWLLSLLEAKPRPNKKINNNKKSETCFKNKAKRSFKNFFLYYFN